MNNYEKIVRANIEAVYKNDLKDVEQFLPADRSGLDFAFRAFGRDCRISPEGIFLSEEKQIGPLGIVISLYALSAGPEKPILAPLKAFKEFPDSMPYAGAFSTHTEQLLIPRVSEISNRRLEIMDILDGGNPPENVPGDFSFLVFPLPKIGLCYIFYEADEDFPAGVTCLYTNNASSFIPIDGLADVGEYTSRTIINLIEPKR